MGVSLGGEWRRLWCRAFLVVCRSRTLNSYTLICTFRAQSRSRQFAETGPEGSSIAGRPLILVGVVHQQRLWHVRAGNTDTIVIDATCTVATEDRISQSRGCVTTITLPGNVCLLNKSNFLQLNLVGVFRKQNMDAPIDISRSAQIRDIEASFAATENFDLSTLKHPNKPNVTAVESYEIFPDAEIWANAYDLFRFSERPGERPPDVCGA